jgi:hypothetical protein
MNKVDLLVASQEGIGPDHRSLAGCGQPCVESVNRQMGRGSRNSGYGAGGREPCPLRATPAASAAAATAEATAGATRSSKTLATT